LCCVVIRVIQVLKGATVTLTGAKKMEEIDGNAIVAQALKEQVKFVKPM
jgi:hypothetical protein